MRVYVVRLLSDQGTDFGSWLIAHPRQLLDVDALIRRSYQLRFDETLIALSRQPRIDDTTTIGSDDPLFHIVVRPVDPSVTLVTI